MAFQKKKKTQYTIALLHTLIHKSSLNSLPANISFKFSESTSPCCSAMQRFRSEIVQDLFTWSSKTAEFWFVSLTCTFNIFPLKRWICWAKRINLVASTWGLCLTKVILLIYGWNKGPFNLKYLPSFVTFTCLSHHSHGLAVEPHATKFPF